MRNLGNLLGYLLHRGCWRRLHWVRLQLWFSAIGSLGLQFTFDSLNRCRSWESPSRSKTRT